MADPMLKAAQQFGGQFAEQQKEKVALLILLDTMILDNKIYHWIQLEILFRRRSFVCWQETWNPVISLLQICKAFPFGL